MTYEQSEKLIKQAIDDFNRAVAASTAAGFDIETRLCGNGSQIYRVDISKTVICY